MNRIEEMIKEMCPDGVAVFPLWKVTVWDKKFKGVDNSMQQKVIRYNYLLADDLEKSISKHGDIRILFTNERVAYAEEQEVKDYISEGEIVAIPWGGTPTVKYYKGRFITGDNRIATSKDTNLLNNKYLYYWFSSRKEELELYYRGAGIKHPSMYSVLCMQIPLPPLPIQQEIVKILDSFTALQQNLEDELKLRQKQYEHYCDKLYGGDYEGMMNMDGVDETKVVTFDDLGTITRGKRFVRDDVREEGQPCIHYGDMYTYYGTKASKAKTHLDRNFPKKMRYANKGDVVIVGAGENNYDIGVGLVWMGDEPAAVHDACYILEHNINPMYISYYLRSNIYHLQLKKYVSEGKICSFSGKDLGRIKIPVQSLEKQSQIVQTLDHFETLISNLKTEIELRKKQYEYYREKLLTF